MNPLAFVAVATASSSRRGQAIQASSIYQSARIFGSSSNSLSIAVGDLNSDGSNDIIVGNDAAPSELYLNDGKGNIPSAPTVTLPGGSHDTFGVATGDFNNDNVADIFVANYNGTQQLLLNAGDGFFPTSQDIPMILDRTAAVDVHAVDINNDGNLDVVIAAFDTGYASNVLFGDGTGNFPTMVELGDKFFQAYKVASGDFDGNGHIDLVITNVEYNDGTTSSKNPGTNLFLNNGSHFMMQNIPHVSGTGKGYGVVVADVDKNGCDDFIVTRWDSGSNILSLNDGIEGAASFTQSILPGYVVDGVTHDGFNVDVADANGDGWPDIAIANIGQPNQLLLNDGKGGFEDADVYDLDGIQQEEVESYAIKFGDINGDSMPDLVIANNGHQNVLLVNDLKPKSIKDGVESEPSASFATASK